MAQIEQKTVMVAANDTDINTSITTEAADGWLLGSITISGGNAILLFSRTIPEEAP